MPPSVSLLNFAGGSSRKSSFSIYKFLPNRISLDPNSGFCGCQSAESHSISFSGKFVRTTLSGFSTHIPRGAVFSKSARMQNSSRFISTVLSCLVTPILSQKSLIARAGTPLLFNPEMVGILGSFQPSTNFSSTNLLRSRLLITVYSSPRRENSICGG